MQQPPNHRYDYIGLIITYLKTQVKLTDDKKIEAVEFLEDLIEEDLMYIFVSKDIAYLLVELYGSVKVNAEEEEE